MVVVETAEGIQRVPAADVATTRAKYRNAMADQLKTPVTEEAVGEMIEKVAQAATEGDLAAQAILEPYITLQTQQPEPVDFAAQLAQAQAVIAQLTAAAQAQAAPSLPPRVEQSNLDPHAVREIQKIKAELEGNPTVYSENIVHSEDDGLTENSQGVLVTHEGQPRIRLYKPTGECRTVPADNFTRLIDPKDGRWTLKCPKCHTDCGGSPWGCGAVPQPEFMRCPVPNCNADWGGQRKRFYLKPQSIRAGEKLEGEVGDPLFDGINGAMAEAKAQLYAHLNAKHPDYALAAGVPQPGQSNGG